MSVELYLVFVLATALLIATPGPNVALIVGTSLTHGARTGLIAMAGVNTGVMIQLPLPVSWMERSASKSSASSTVPPPVTVNGPFTFTPLVCPLGLSDYSEMLSILRAV